MDRFDLHDVTLPAVVSCFVFLFTFRLQLDHFLILLVFLFTNLVVMVLWFTNKDESQENLKVFLDGLRVAAHRGAAMDAPENTMAAFLQVTLLSS